MPSNQPLILEDIVEQYVEEAPFLWERRDAAVKEPNYALYDLAFLDERIEAHLDGIRVAGDIGWKLCKSAMSEDEPGTVFAAAVIAFGSGDAKRIDGVIEEGSASEATFRALKSAVAWLDNDSFKAVISMLVKADEPGHRRLGIAACGLRRVDPRAYLDKALQDTDPVLKAAAIRTAGQLKRLDLLPLITQELHSEDHACRFEAARAAILLGDRSALPILGQFIQAGSRYCMPAMEIVLRAMDMGQSKAALKSLSSDRKQLRNVLVGMGISGDPSFIPMLIRQMTNPVFARAAGESFSMITGADLTEEGLEGEWPEGFEAGPTDDPEDEDVGMDPDEDLAWPDADRVAEWWSANQGAFTAGMRYLAGRAISPQECAEVLNSGMQRQRSAAALEMALSQADTPWFNTKAPGALQRSQL